MCGLAALFTLKNTEIAGGLKKVTIMRDKMQARGPDGNGVWHDPDGQVFLAHNRLSIIDPRDVSAQPFSSEDGNYVIVFNGEIYNYKALRTSLESDGVRFRTDSDTEVLLNLYIRHGRSMFQMLRGMFAFAIWDNRKKGLLVARDQFGIKPLYYTFAGGAFSIASQVKALVAASETSFQPCAAGQSGFFMLGYIPEPFTAYKNIYSLEAGAYMWVDQEHMHPKPVKYFSLTEVFADAQHNEISDSDAIAQMQLGLEESVRAHLVSDVDVGLFLSSGRDSAVLASFLHEVSPSTIQAITLNFGEYKNTKFDETCGAKLIADSFNIQHSIYNQSSGKLLEEGTLQAFFSAMDQPTIDGINTYFVSNQAQQHGLKVCLSGLGADEILQGYPLFQQIPRTVSWMRGFNGFPKIAKAIRQVSNCGFQFLKKPKLAGLLEYGGQTHSAYFLTRALFMPWELSKILPPETVSEGLEKLNVIGRMKETVQGITDPRLQICCLELSWYVRNQLLRSTDWSSMAHSLEVRVPFLDVDLLKAWTPLMASNRGLNKTDMTDCAPHQLPEKIVKKGKLGFNVPVEHWASKLSPNAGVDSSSYRGWAKYVNSQYYA